MKKKLLLLVLTVCSASLTSSAQEANYDESKVKPYTLEDPLRFVDLTGSSSHLHMNGAPYPPFCCSTIRATKA